MSKRGIVTTTPPWRDFFLGGVLKKELAHRKSYSTRAEAIADATEYTCNEFFRIVTNLYIFIDTSTLAWINADR